MAGKKQAQNRGQFKPGQSGNPAGRPSAVRTDGFVNEYTGHGTSYDVGTATRHYTRPVTETEAIDLRRGNWLARRIVTLLPADCFRKGYTLKLGDKEAAEAVMSVVESMGINLHAVTAGAMENTVGGAALYPVLDGAVGEAHEPLDLDAAPRILSVRAIHMLESRELQPLTWYGDINHPKYRKPETYQVFALSSGGSVRATPTVLHESRLAIFPGEQVSVEQQPGQPWGWGDSKLTPVRDEINNFGVSWGSAAAILRNFGERVIKVKDLTKILAAKGGPAALQSRLAFADKYRSTLRGQIFEDTDSVETLLDSIAGMGDLMLQLAQLVSAAADIPITRLFGMSPAGMNATGEYDMGMWHERIETEQKHKYTAPIEWLIRLILLSADGPTGGEEPDVWSIEWKPLKSQTEKEIADTRKTVAETDQIYFGMGMPAERILEDRFGGDTYSMETTFDAAAFKAQQAEEQRMAEEARAAELEAMKQRGSQNGPNGEPTDEKPSGAEKPPGDEEPVE